MFNKKFSFILSNITLVFLYTINVFICFDIRKGIYNRWKKSLTSNFPSDSLLLNDELNSNKPSSSKLRGRNRNAIENILKSSDISSLSKSQIIQKLENLELIKNSESFNYNKKEINDTNSNDSVKGEDFKEFYFETKIDHFSYENQNTFKLRYLVKDKYVSKLKSADTPIFFYCGNEGPIEDFWKNSGFITESLAKQFNALVVFGEHRFFGKSFPFGALQDKDIKKNKYLTSEQALSDFVELLTYIKNKYSLEKSSIIAFGGSYGGMLSSWARMKFPHIFSGAVASSAPVLLFEDIEKIKNSFFKITTDTYKRYDEQCPRDLRAGFQKLFDFRTNPLIASNPSILNILNEIFIPCTKIQNSYDIKKLEESLEDMLITLAQYNYPYETAFIKPTPAEPVKVACERVAEIRNNTQFLKLSPIISNSINFAFNKYNQVDLDSKYKLKFLKAAVDVFYNYTGVEKCLDIGNNNSTSGNESNLNGWSFMACTEMIMPMEKDGYSDMFNPQKWNLDDYQDECKNEWQADVRPNWIYNFYGGRNFYNEIMSYSNIIYINGKMDPWNAGCPKYSNNTNVIVFEADSAHHLDLRLPHEKDPESVLKARKLIEVLIEKWIVSNEN